MATTENPAPTGRPMGKNAVRVMKAISAVHTRVYRLSGGRIGGSMRGVPMLLVSHTGRKSGKRRTTPLLYLQDGEDMAIVGSAGGTAKHPAWVLNLQANPEAEVQVGKRKLKVRAHTADPEEKARLWPKLVALFPGYDQYQRNTAREIPVIVLRSV